MRRASRFIALLGAICAAASAGDRPSFEVIETTNFHPLHAGGIVPLTQQGRVTEKLTRVSPSEILYEFTVEDPSVYARPWRAEMTFNATRERVFEYACHEGNYALPGILAGAREQERQQASTTR